MHPSDQGREGTQYVGAGNAPVHAADFALISSRLEPLENLRCALSNLTARPKI